MTAQQENALARNPNQLDLVRVATYTRCIEASIDRVWENVLDWEHLPWLHDTSFDFVALDEGGEWGWRTWSNPDKTGSVELCVNREASEYVARSYVSGNQISEIWTHLAPAGPATNITVTFELPDIPPDRKDRMGDIFLNLYTRLWDEDEEMMQRREHRLQQRFQASDTPSEIKLDKPLALPTTVSLGRHDWTLREVNGDVIVHSAICPHLLGPIDDTIDDTIATDGSTLVRCPWHGYQFDVITGECTEPKTATCALKSPPLIQDYPTYILLKTV